jgi:hypothetical protein
MLACAACHGDDASHATSDANAAADAIAEPVDAGIADAGRGKVAQVGAASFITSVSDMAAFPESKTGARRMGYLRAGATVAAYDKPIVNEDCKSGWYELVTGGFVCSKTATFDLSDSRVKHAPKQPDLRAAMPYRYGVNLGSDTPLYRRVLSVDDRKKYEPWLAPKPAPEESTQDNADDPTATATTTSTTTTTASSTSTPTSSSSSSTSSTDDDTPEPPKHATRDAGTERADAGPPKLRELRGRGVLVRRMVRGFYLALDRDFKAAHAHWWRTTFGFAVPFDRVMLQPGVTKHHGAWFQDMPGLASDAGVNVNVYPFDASAFPLALPFALAGGGDDAGGSSELDAGTNLFGAVAFVNNGYAHKVEVKDDKPGWGPELARRSAVMLTGRTLAAGGSTYDETTGGFWVRSGDVMLAHPQPPKDLAPNEKWIDVDLTRQALVAFEGMRPVFATLISSGRRNKDDKEKDFPTPTGNFRIREKHVTTTMDGDVASDGPYSIEDVPWVMYFEGSYALHGAFWHDQFGNKRSHGCVNLAPEDARTLFSWTDPKLPDGWHGVYSRDDLTGTRLVIHEEKERH